MVVKSNAGSTLLDLGEGIACLEFHSKMNAIGGDTIHMMKAAIDEVEENFEGLVIGNHGGNFSAGANLMLLLLEAQEENWDEIDLFIRSFQNAALSLRYSSKPVAGRALWPGPGRRLRGLPGRPDSRLDRDLHGSGRSGSRSHSCRHGCKEMVLRAMEMLPPGSDANFFPYRNSPSKPLPWQRFQPVPRRRNGWGSCDPVTGSRQIATGCFMTPG